MANITSFGQTNYIDLLTRPDVPPLPVWTTTNTRHIDGVERYHLGVCADCIAQMPAPVKVIIARYTAFLPDYLLDEETELIIAQALGDFSTLQEARQTLLKDWTGEDLVIPNSALPFFLKLKMTENLLFVERSGVYGRTITDEFIIDENEKITCIKQN